MSAMKIEDLLNPKEDSLPGLFTKILFKSFLVLRVCMVHTIIFCFLFTDELLAKNIFLKDNPDLISKVEKSIEGQ